MKARIPVKLKRETMAEINRLADREYQKVKDKEIADVMRTSQDEFLRQLYLPCIRISALVVTDVQRL